MPSPCVTLLQAPATNICNTAGGYHTTISLLVREVCQAIVDEYQELLSPPDTEEEWRRISADWYRRWNFPNTIGAVDGKHIACKAPPNTGSPFYNYKKYFSIILFAMVSSDYKFLYVDLSAHGHMSDSQIFNQSDLRGRAGE